MIIQQTFTLFDFLATVESAPCVVAANEAAREAWRRRNNFEWCGLDANAGPSPTEATIALARNGWAEGVNLLSDVPTDKDPPTPRTIRRRLRWGDYGDDVDMQRIWAGQLETAWRRPTKAQANGPARVRIIVDSIAYGSEDSASMRWRGVAALRLSDALTEAGYSVQVESGFTALGSDDANNKYVLRTIVKPYEAPLDLAALAATTALPAFFRALGHEWHLIAAPGQIISNSFFVDPLEVKFFADANDAAPLVLATSAIKTAESAVEWVRKSIQQIESPAEAAA